MDPEGPGIDQADIQQQAPVIRRPASLGPRPTEIPERVQGTVQSFPLPDKPIKHTRRAEAMLQEEATRAMMDEEVRRMEAASSSSSEPVSSPEKADIRTRELEMLSILAKNFGTNVETYTNNPESRQILADVIKEHPTWNNPRGLQRALDQFNALRSWEANHAGERSAARVFNKSEQDRYLHDAQELRDMGSEHRAREAENDARGFNEADFITFADQVGRDGRPTAGALGNLAREYHDSMVDLGTTIQDQMGGLDDGDVRRSIVDNPRFYLAIAERGWDDPATLARVIDRFNQMRDSDTSRSFFNQNSGPDGKWRDFQSFVNRINADGVREGNEAAELRRLMEKHYQDTVNDTIVDIAAQMYKDREGEATRKRVIAGFMQDAKVNNLPVNQRTRQMMEERADATVEKAARDWASNVAGADQAKHLLLNTPQIRDRFLGKDLFNWEDLPVIIEEVLESGGSYQGQKIEVTRNFNPTLSVPTSEKTPAGSQRAQKMERRREAAAAMRAIWEKGSS